MSLRRTPSIRSQTGGSPKDGLPGDSWRNVKAPTDAAAGSEGKDDDDSPADGPSTGWRGSHIRNAANNPGRANLRSGRGRIGRRSHRGIWKLR